METAGKGWEREGSSVPGGHLFTIISERSERAIDHSEVNQGMRVDRLHGVLSAQARVLTVRLHGRCARRSEYREKIRSEIYYLVTAAEGEGERLERVDHRSWKPL